MKKLIVLIALPLLTFCAKTVEKKGPILKDNYNSELISAKDTNAKAPYLTTNHLNEPVMVWTEGEGDRTVMVYTISKDYGKTFETPVYIKESEGLSAHDEGMAKIAYKQDGTIIAVFGIREATEQNKYAGSLYYTMSNDNGSTWSKRKAVHSNTEKGIGRSFIDIERLPDGEVGAVWLDGRKKSRNGSTLLFAKTTKGHGFAKDIEIAQTTCQCCRTELHVDKSNNIQIVFRDITGDNIRDMGSIVSTDSGKTFSEPVRISADNWKVDGCPHTGPTIASTSDKLDYYWFSSGGGNGIYHTSSMDGGRTFAERNMIDKKANHPQAIGLKDDKIALVYDETVRGNKGVTDLIGIKVFESDGKMIQKYISTDDVSAHHPVITEMPNGQLLVAWTQITDFGEAVYYTII